MDNIGHQTRWGDFILETLTCPKGISVCQVVGENSTQQCIDRHVRIPCDKPAIEEIVNVYIRNIHVTDVRIIPDNVIVCGHFEAKAIYSACKPSQPVHAAEVRRIKFAATVPICGARCGMDADASVFVEYVDYYCSHRYYNDWSHKPHQGSEHNWNDGHHDPHKEGYDCCHEYHGWKPECEYDCHHGHDDCHHHHHHWDHHCDPCDPHCFRDFDISVVLEINVKVTTTRDLIIYPGYPNIPAKPKG